MLAKNKDEYLEKLKEEFNKSVTISNQPMLVHFDIFLEQEKQKSDLFTFMQIFCPKLYNKYVHIAKNYSGDQDIKGQRQAMEAF